MCGTSLAVERLRNLQNRCLAFEPWPIRASFCLFTFLVRYRPAGAKVLPNSSRIEAIGSLADPRVQQVRVALERDQRACVAGDSLDELDVGACGDEA